MNLAHWLDEHQEKFIEISDRIWEYAELSYHEEQSAALLAETMRQAGFTIHQPAADLKTAFVAEFGSGSPVIGIMGEFDALPGLSQTANSTTQQALTPGGAGHGCGHNLFGAASAAAAVAVKEAISAGDLSGTIRFYGTPAEERGAGKVFMAKAGLFDDVDVCLAWHPASTSGALTMNFLANADVKYRFHGKTAHAAADPFNGRSALDAVELMNVGANYLREHIIPEARIHYIITNGGVAPNIVPDEAEVFYYVRAPKTHQVVEVMERLNDVARGAALMTGTTLEINHQGGVMNLLINHTISRVMHAQLEALGPIPFDEADQAFARELVKGLPPSSYGMYAQMLGKSPEELAQVFKARPLMGDVMPYVEKEIVIPGSSDVGDVSWVTPTGQLSTATQAMGTPGHSWMVVTQAAMSIGHKGMIQAAKGLALTAEQFMRDPALVKQAREEFAEERAKYPFLPLTPDGATPAID
ncbi:MAG: amidohydrolase [Anaerolineaceae bacterium]|nr:amidohydrolase [Anaerolineaceae bacterium]